MASAHGSRHHPGDEPGTTVENGTFSTVATMTADAVLEHQSAEQAAMVRLQRAARAESTRSCYAHDREDLRCYLRDQKLPGPPVSGAVLATYVAELLTGGSPSVESPRPLRPSTVQRRLAAIRTWHHDLGLPAPDLTDARNVLRGYQRTTAPTPGKAAPITVAVLRGLLAQVELDGQQGHPSRALRDRAMILLGFAAGTRRSELVRITMTDIVTTAEGLLISILRAKTKTMPDVVPIAWAGDPLLCPVRAVLAWKDRLVAQGASDGPLFRRITATDHVLDHQLKPAAVADVLRRLTTAAQLPLPEGFRSWSPHGLRRGMVSEARKAGADLHGIATLGGWAASSTSLSSYIAEVDRWVQHPLKGVL